jgi:hypothetical protein
VAFESIAPHWWAGDLFGCSLKPNGWGRWGANIQNGGAILYVSYYDVLARLLVNGPDDAFERFSQIIGEFHQDSLRSDTPGYYGPAGAPASNGPVFEIFSSAESATGSRRNEVPG